MALEVFALGRKHQIDPLHLAQILPVRRPLESPVVVGLLRTCLTKLNALEPVDLDPFHFVNFAILGAISSLGRKTAWIAESVGKVSSIGEMLTINEAASAPPGERHMNDLRLVLLAGPIGWHGPRHALAVPLCLLPAGESCRLRSRRLSLLSNNVARGRARWTRTTFFESLGEIAQRESEANQQERQNLFHSWADFLF